MLPLEQVPSHINYTFPTRTGCAVVSLVELCSYKVDSQLSRSRELIATLWWGAQRWRTCGWLTRCEWRNDFQVFWSCKNSRDIEAIQPSSVNQFDSIGFIDRSTISLNYSVDTNTDIPWPLVADHAKTHDARHPNIIGDGRRGSGSALHIFWSWRRLKKRNVWWWECHVPRSQRHICESGPRFVIITAHNAGGARGMRGSELTATDL